MSKGRREGEETLTEVALASDRIPAEVSFRGIVASQPGR